MRYNFAEVVQHTLLDPIRFITTCNSCINTVKKVSGFPVPSRDVTFQTLPGREQFNYSRPGPVVIKKDDEPLLNLTVLKREGA
jgi:hypothetical protein